jgi:hypothetical protein
VRWLTWTAIVCASVWVIFAVAFRYAVRNAGPILRQRVIATLEQRFGSPVQLDSLNIAFTDGIEVSGAGLRIIDFGRKETDASLPDDQPMLSVESFDFHTTVRHVLDPVTHIGIVHVRGMVLNIPPKGKRGPLLRPKKLGRRGLGELVVDRIICSDMTLSIRTDRPGKLPLVFTIHDLTLQDIGSRRPFLFDARLVNPKPIGDIHSTGQFGPWNQDEPRDTPIEGQYSFTNADLGPIKGVAGILSSTGKYGGALSQIGVTGTTDTPNFSLDVSDHPVHLQTQFDATVDGTSGDTRLNHVHATFLQSVLDVTGMVLQANGAVGRKYAAGLSLTPQAVEELKGHYIDINVVTRDARIEDMLTLGVRARPPIMRGALALQAHIAIPPGDQSVSKKMRMQGQFGIRQATFANAKWQQTLDQLSARAEGHPSQVNATGIQRVASQMSGSFSLGSAMLSIPELVYEVPGAKVSLHGRYGLDGRTFDFAGNVQTKATASQMLTGWKHWLAKPFDPLFEKHGAGLEVPVTISGTRSDIKFGVDKGKLGKEIFTRNKDHTEIKTQDEKIVGDPQRVRPQPQQQAAEPEPGAADPR